MTIDFISKGLFMLWITLCINRSIRLHLPLWSRDTICNFRFRQLYSTHKSRDVWSIDDVIVSDVISNITYEDFTNYTNKTNGYVFSATGSVGVYCGMNSALR